MTDLRKWSENAFVMLAGLKEAVQWELAPEIMKEIKELVDAYPVSAALSPARSGEPSAPPACPECKTQLRDETAWYRCDTCHARYSSTMERGLYRLPGDRFAAPQTRLRPYFPPASQTPDFKTLNATIGDLGEIAEMLREPQHEPTGFDLSIALRLEQITQTLKSIDPLATPASTAQPAAPSLEECARAETWIEEWVDGTLGKGNRPCGWPNFGSISVKEVAAMLEAYRRHFAGAAGQPPLDKLRAIVFDQGRDVEYETPGSVPQAPNNHSDLFFGNLQYSLQTLFAKVGNPFKDLAEWGAVWEALESARKHFGVPQAEPPKEEKP